MTRAVAAGLAAVLAITVPAAAADFSDPRGDAGTAPDITTVSATPSTESITFRVVVANMDRLAPDAELFLAVDTDRSTRTGDQHGVDFVYSLREEGSLLRTRRWSGSQHVSFPSTAAGAYQGGVATFVLQLAELGSPAAISFGAVGARGADSDAAPGNGSWPLVLRETLRVSSVTVRFAPAAPVAGKPFRVASASGTLSDGTRRAGAVAACTARIAGAALAGRRCAWRVPASARRKPLLVGVRVRVPNVGTATRTYRFSIR
jgi:hypothetical protein